MKAMQAYADQQVAIAVEKAFGMAANKVKYGYTPEEVKEHILSLAPQVLKELKGGEGDD